MLTQEETQRLAHYLAGKLHVDACEIANVVRIQGGASRETMRFDAVTPERRRGFILQRDPPAAANGSTARIEFAALQSFHDSCRVPAPRPIALCEDVSVLGRPFMVMQRIDNAFATPPFLPNPFGEHLEKIGQSFFRILGAIHSADPKASDLAGVVKAPAARACWSRELDRWEGMIERNALEPQPIVMAAIRRLRRNPPPAPARLSIVHGDYRNGNFLHDGAGGITGILDWEMAHIGDAQEDLAWALDPLWAGKSGLAAGMLPFDEAIRIWSEASGREFDPASHAWWSLFSAVKGVAAWLSCGRRYTEEPMPEAILGFTGWYCLGRHNKAIADRLSASPPKSPLGIAIA